jgi:hypothetical protein
MSLWYSRTELDEQGRRTTVSVYAVVGGTERLMGNMNFRVKRVPDPVAQIGNQSGGNIRREDLEIEDGVLAVCLTLILTSDLQLPSLIST